MVKRLSSSTSAWIACCHLLLASALVCSSKSHENSADILVDIINNNRTSLKLLSLNRSPGIGCMALQYAEFCKGNCTSDNTLDCRPSDADFIEIFAPNCGIELPTFGSITGHIVGCHSKNLSPSQAFADVLIRDNGALSLLRNRSHSEVGVGVVRGSHKGPSYWCILFSRDRVNTTFVLEDQGMGIKQKKGCFSGSSSPCNTAAVDSGKFVNLFMAVTCLWVLLLTQL
ncbi:hypothetical protein SAY87_025269 [Trapa incisa]|uniref:Ferredoxin-like protein n=1 Tax=Trapa incisa TaxID=236973 RepID=A0AAN7J9B6_9MYRT|nr:hypothetical protein SAY87_025269 [Trapa incisa]